MAINILPVCVYTWSLKNLFFKQNNISGSFRIGKSTKLSISTSSGSSAFLYSRSSGDKLDDVYHDRRDDWRDSLRYYNRIITNV